MYVFLFCPETSANDVVYKPTDDAGPARRQWGPPQKTQVVSALEKAKIMTATTAAGGDEPDASKRISVLATPEENSVKTVVPTEEKSAIGVTVTLPKGSVNPSPDLGVTVTKSPVTPKTVVLRREETPTSPSEQIVTTTSTNQVKDTITSDEGVENVKEVSLNKNMISINVAASPRSPVNAWTDESQKGNITC